MGKLYFRYGAMGASKSAGAIMTAFNYKMQDRGVILMKPSIDTRWSSQEVVSRAGDMRMPCKLISPSEDLYMALEKYSKSAEKPFECIIIDEAQFLTKEHVKSLAKYLDDFDVVSICYGLKNSAIEGELFEGSKALLYWADSIEELKTLCSCCNKKATMNLRVIDGKPVRKGDVIFIGDTEKKGKEFYIPTCRKHYNNPTPQSLIIDV